MILGALIGLLVAGGATLVLYSLTPAPVGATVTGASGRPPTRTELRARAMRARLSSNDRRILAGASAIGLLLAIVTGWIVAIIALPLMAWGLPRLLFPPKATNVDALEALEEWSRRLASLFTSGSHLNEVLVASLYSCPEPIRPQVSMLVSRLQARQATAQALYAFADDLNDETGDMIASVLIRGATETGATLGSLLTDLSTMVATEVEKRRNTATVQAGPRSEARLITIIAIVSIAGIILFTPYGAWYSTPVGQIALLMLLAAFGGCLWWIHRIATPIPPERFLVRPGTGGAS